MNELIPSGVHIDIPERFYHLDPAWSYSKVKKAQPTMKDYWQYENGPPFYPSTFMNVGTLIGRLILEPDREPYDGFVIKPKPRAPNGWEDEQNALGNMVLSEKDFEEAHGCAKSLSEDETAGPILRGKGMSEVTLVHEMELEVDGVLIPIRIRGRVDRVPNGVDYLVDLKKVQCCQPGEWRQGKEDKYWVQSPFARVIGEHDYNMQAGLYRFLWNTLVPQDPRDKWVNACVEQKAPHKVKCFQMEEDSMWEGLNLFWRLLKGILRCQMSGKWPGYSKEIEPIGLERYHL